MNDDFTDVRLKDFVREWQFKKTSQRYEYLGPRVIDGEWVTSKWSQ